MASLISFVVIISVYQPALSEMNKNGPRIQFYPETRSDFISGLISSNINLIIVFVSLIPFIVYLVWIIFKDKNDSSELIILTKDEPRISISLQKFVVAIAGLFINTSFLLFAFLILAGQDKIMFPSESYKWAASMFIGAFIVSILMLSIVVILSTFLKIIPLFFVTVSISIVMPMTSVVMLENNNLTPWLSVPQLKTQSQNRMYFNDNGILQQKEISIGRGVELPSSLYKEKYHKYDSWTAIQSLFSIFSGDNNKNVPRGTWSDKKRLGELVDFNDSNSIKIGSRRYALLWMGSNHPSRQPEVRDGYHWKEVGPSNQHYSNIFTLLENDDAMANSFKNLPLLYQLSIMHELFITDDNTNDTKTFFNKCINRLNPQTYFEGMHGNSFTLFADLIEIDNSNKDRFLPNSIEPDSQEWKLWRDIAIDGSDRWISNLPHLSSEDDYRYWYRVNEKYGVSKTIIAIWSVIFVLLLPMSVGTYLRKDFK